MQYNKSTATVGLCLLMIFCPLAPNRIATADNAADNAADSTRKNAAPESVSPTAADVLFVVLAKMSLYDQSPSGVLTLRNHHFVAELMPKAGREIISGYLTSATDATQVIQFAPEGNAFMAHGARVTDPTALHEIHPDGNYVFTYTTQSGRMQHQELALRKRAAIHEMPAPARVSALQNGQALIGPVIDPDADLLLSWDLMQGNLQAADSELPDLAFVLTFDCFGNNVDHSGRPYQGGSYLTFADSNYRIPASALQPGLEYTVVVEQATADVQSTLGVPGISTYATLTFLKMRTAGHPVDMRCPVPAA